MSSLLQPRDSFVQFSRISSVLKAQRGLSLEVPLLTIAIPTYKRVDTLLEAVDSALGQRTTRPYEVLVIDNDPDSAKWSALMSGIELKPNQQVRYYVNSSNLGMFGNWNRCIDLAVAEWVTILNDDDLLRPAFLERCFKLIQQRPETDGIVCGKTLRDRRLNRPPPPAQAAPAVADRLLWSFTERVRRLQFRRGFKQLTVKRLFFGNDIGNGAGFLFRKDAARQLGGYDPADWPVADFFFYLRFAKAWNLYWLPEELAEVGIGDNESLSKDTLMGFIAKVQEARQDLAGSEVPKSWLKLSPQLVANHLHAARVNWDSNIGADEVEQSVGFSIPEPSHRRETLSRLRRGAL